MWKGGGLPARNGACTGPGISMRGSLPGLACWGRFAPLLRSHSCARHLDQASRCLAEGNRASPAAHLEAAVPKDQRPVNELAQLKDDMLYSWGALDLKQYIQRLAGIFGFFLAVLGGPIAYQTFNPSEQPFEWVLSASVGSLVVVAIVVVRIFLGWAYVSDRLLSASYAYEETGWYDGQTFVKPPEVLTRDRLLGMYETKPVLKKLRVTLVGSGVMLLTSSFLLFGIIKAESDEYGMYGRGAAKPQPQLVASIGMHPNAKDEPSAVSLELQREGFRDYGVHSWEEYEEAVAEMS